MNMYWTKSLEAGEKWSGVVKKGSLFRLTASGNTANVSMLLFNTHDRTERYNMPDTLKAQHTSHLTKGHVLMSDNGKAMAGIIEDDTGWHDSFGGFSKTSWTDAQFGKTTYQSERNERYRSGEENFSMELFRNGLTMRDTVPVVNVFSKVAVKDGGEMVFHQENAGAGEAITFRTEMDLLIVLSNTPHPLDTSTVYPSVPVKLEAGVSEPIAENDICLNLCGENRRAYENTWEADLLSEGFINSPVSAK